MANGNENRTAENQTPAVSAVSNWGAFLGRVRPTAIIFAVVILLIVWMSYHYTAHLVGHGLELMKLATDDNTIKDGVIQMLTGIVSNMVAVGAVTGLVGALKETISAGDDN